MADFIEQIYNKGSVSGGGQIAKRKVGVVLPKICAYPAFFIYFFFTFVTLIIFLKI